MADNRKPETSRIAIKFGGSSSGSAKKPSWPAPASALGKRPRARPGLGDESESGSEDDSRPSGRHERITAFGVNGAELEREGRDDRPRTKHEPLVIAKQADRDWRSETKARRQRDQQHKQARSTGPTLQKETELADKDKPISWGLTLTKKAAPEETDGADDNKNGKDGKDSKETDSKEKEGTSDSKDGAEKEISDEHNIEKAAVNALLGRTIDDRTKTKLVIEGTVNQELAEEDVFRRDFHDAPEVSTLAEYDAMPVDEFGAALLRGMGWDGKDRGPKVKQVKRRPNQMGLGAKELKGDEELGAWNAKGTQNGRKARPPRLHEYRREQEKRRERREDRHRDSYKTEREREREGERDDRRYGRSSSSKHRDDGRRRR